MEQYNRPGRTRVIPPSRRDRRPRIFRWTASGRLHLCQIIGTIIQLFRQSLKTSCFDLMNAGSALFRLGILPVTRSKNSFSVLRSSSTRVLESGPSVFTASRNLGTCRIGACLIVKRRAVALVRHHVAFLRAVGNTCRADRINVLPSSDLLFLIGYGSRHILIVGNVRAALTGFHCRRAGNA